jgi:hypothetical protein
MALGVSLSSSRRERTTRASSMGLDVRAGAFARRIEALRATPQSGSTTIGTSLRPSSFH